MKALKFTASSDFAFFKKPDVNRNIYFTYSAIHKVAVMGMLGAMMGYGGYNKQNMMNRASKGSAPFPEFYEKLKSLQVSVVPKQPQFQKKSQTFNNSTGFASSETGGNLIIKEQWLEKPSWDIYILLDCEEAEKVAQEIVNDNCIYTPYLGKNDHPANITEAEIIEVVEFKADTPVKIDSFFLKNNFKLVAYDEFANLGGDKPKEHKSQENFPIGLDAEFNQYIYAEFMLTNMSLQALENTRIFDAGNKHIAFY